MWESRWVRYHAVAAPFGILAVTALLAYFTDSGQGNGGQGLSHAATLVDLAVPIYAAFAVLVERGVAMVFWALEQRKKWRDERLAAQAAREAAQATREAVVRAETRAEMMQDMEAWRARVAQEKGIPIEELPPLPV